MADLGLDERAIRKIMSVPIVKSTDMDPEIVGEVKDQVAMLIDKALPTKNWDDACKQLKQWLDKKAGAPWQVACGEGMRGPPHFRFP
mmetsp:Transcript_14188/g.33620  ORF Transcript_14188/g.33620 Transcript_14188/m.33620 type:complete len:87 (+) Transcript_14188:162-422(+)